MVIPNQVENLRIYFETIEDPGFSRSIAQKARRRRENELNDLKDKSKGAVVLCQVLIATAI